MRRFWRVPAGSAALSIERIAYLAGGQPVEFTRSFYRGDIYDFVAELNLGQDSMTETHMAAEIRETPAAVARLIDREGAASRRSGATAGARSRRDRHLRARLVGQCRRPISNT